MVMICISHKYNDGFLVYILIRPIDIHATIVCVYIRYVYIHVIIMVTRIHMYVVMALILYNNVVIIWQQVYLTWYIIQCI